jgi:hypothetical protein
MKNRIFCLLATIVCFGNIFPNCASAKENSGWNLGVSAIAAPGHPVLLSIYFRKENYFYVLDALPNIGNYTYANFLPLAPGYGGLSVLRNIRSNWIGLGLSAHYTDSSEGQGLLIGPTLLLLPGKILFISYRFGVGAFIYKPNLNTTVEKTIRRKENNDIGITVLGTYNVTFGIEI